MKLKAVKGLFLDRAHVIRKIGEAKVRALMRSGGRLRTTARRSMRYREKLSLDSLPGRPPFAHKRTGAKLRNFLLFFFDPRTDSVVVGPTPLGKGKAPSLHEFGGQTMVTKLLPRAPSATSFTQKQTFRRKVLSGEITVAPRPKTKVIVNYPKRPFMEPALRINEPKMPKDWANTVVGP